MLTLKENKVVSGKETLAMRKRLLLMLHVTMTVQKNDHKNEHSSSQSQKPSKLWSAVKNRRYYRAKGHFRVIFLPFAMFFFMHPVVFQSH